MTSQKFNYKKEILPIVKKLCEADGNKAEANHGQMQEILKDFAKLCSDDLEVLATFIRYVKNGSGN